MVVSLKNPPHSSTRLYWMWAVYAIAGAILLKPSVSFQPPRALAPRWGRDTYRKLVRDMPIPYLPIGKTSSGGRTPVSVADVVRLSSTGGLPPAEQQGRIGGSGGPAAHRSLRHLLRQWTGFSLTALRATLRAATGLSLTAVYAAALAATGAWIRRINALVLGVFPAWLRYFAQPFLVLYYAPLFVVRSVTGPTGAAAQQKHERLLDEWKRAVEAADRADGGGWPVHVRDGTFEADSPEVDLGGAIVDAVQMSLEEEREAEETSSLGRAAML